MSPPVESNVAHATMVSYADRRPPQRQRSFDPCCWIYPRRGTKSDIKPETLSGPTHACQRDEPDAYQLRFSISKTKPSGTLAVPATRAQLTSRRSLLTALKTEAAPMPPGRSAINLDNQSRMPAIRSQVSP